MLVPVKVTRARVEIAPALSLVSFDGPADQGVEHGYDGGTEEDRGNRMREESPIVPVGDD